MINAGWEPVYVKADESSYRRWEDRPELVSCAPTGLMPCKFLWKKNGKTIAFCTSGEGEDTYFDSICDP